MSYSTWYWYTWVTKLLKSSNKWYPIAEMIMSDTDPINEASHCYENTKNTTEKNLRSLSYLPNFRPWSHFASGFEWNQYISIFEKEICLFFDNNADRIKLGACSVILLQTKRANERYYTRFNEKESAHVFKKDISGSSGFIQWLLTRDKMLFFIYTSKWKTMSYLSYSSPSIARKKPSYLLYIPIEDFVNLALFW